MKLLSLVIAVLLGWALGKNNMGNLFGTAVGTRMIRLRYASVLALIFVFLGAFCSSAATTDSILSISALKTPIDIMVIMLSSALVLEGLSKYGIPASIVQTIVGSLIGWNIYHRILIDWTLVKQLIVAWLSAPVLAAVFSWLLMKGVRYFLRCHPLSVFTRDILMRSGLIIIGALSAYTLGANNTGIITAPYMGVFTELTLREMTIIACGGITLGCLMADKKVIATVGRKLFPLSPTEALTVMIGTVISMICFSMACLRNGLNMIHLPSFPLVPIPMSSVMIGAICGIALTKSGRGLNMPVLVKIISSWFMVPIIACGLCYSLLCIIHWMITL